MIKEYIYKFNNGNNIARGRNFELRRVSTIEGFLDSDDVWDEKNY